MIGAELEKPDASAAVVVERHQVFVPLAGMIDLDAERERLRKEIDGQARLPGLGREEAPQRGVRLARASNTGVCMSVVYFVRLLSLLIL